MRKLLSVFLGAALCISSLACFSLTASAEAAVFSTDFSDSSAINGFFRSGPDNGRWGDWSVKNGKLEVKGTSGASWWGTSFLTENTYSDFVMEFDADVSAGYGILLRAQDDGATAGAGLNTWFGGNAYCIMHWVPVETSASICNYDYNGKSDQLISFGGAIGAMTAAHWKITASGSTISMELTDLNNSENKLVHSFTSDLYSAGHIGFYNLTADGVTSLKIDNLVITGDPVTEKDGKVWNDSFNGASGDCYTPYGLWWNNATSFLSGTAYSGVVGNEGAEGAGWTYYYLKNYEMKDFEAEFDVSTASASTTYGIMLRAGNPCGDADGGNGYGIMYDGSWMFAGKMDGSFTQLTVSDANYAYNPTDNGITVKHWRVVCSGDTMTVYLNRSHVAAMSVKDSSFKAGFVGFRTLTPANTNGNVLIDNFTVSGARLGDVNSDGNVDIKDIIRYKKYFADNQTAFAQGSADITGNDGAVDTADMLRLNKYLLGMYGTVYNYG